MRSSFKTMLLLYHILLIGNSLILTCTIFILATILKKEELYRRHYTSEADLMKGIHRFIDFYNSERPHSTIQYKTPEQKEKEYWDKKKESSFEVPPKS